MRSFVKFLKEIWRLSIVNLDGMSRFKRTSFFETACVEKLSSDELLCGLIGR